MTNRFWRFSDSPPRWRIPSSARIAVHPWCRLTERREADAAGDRRKKGEARAAGGLGMGWDPAEVLGNGMKWQLSMLIKCFVVGFGHFVPPRGKTNGFGGCFFPTTKEIKGNRFNFLGTESTPGTESCAVCCLKDNFTGDSASFIIISQLRSSLSEPTESTLSKDDILR